MVSVPGFLEPSQADTPILLNVNPFCYKAPIYIFFFQSKYVSYLTVMQSIKSSISSLKEGKYALLASGIRST